MIGAKYTLTVNGTSDVRLGDGTGDEAQKPKHPVKLEYLGSASLPAKDQQPPQAQATNGGEGARTMADSSLLREPCPGKMGELFDSGREWRAWAPGERYAYVYGFMEGQSRTYLRVFNDLSSERRETLRKEAFLFYPLDTVSDVMTDLYKDPSNTFIDHTAMIYIARDKIAGKDIEPMLRYSREHDVECTPRTGR